MGYRSGSKGEGRMELGLWRRMGSSRSARLVLAGLGLCATVVVISSMAEVQLANAWHLRELAKAQRLHAMGIDATLDGKEVGGALQGAPSIMLTPESARAVLRLPEREQKMLILKPTGIREEIRQFNIVQSLGEGAHGREKAHSTLKMPRPEHHATPAQKKAQMQWALIFVTGIVTASVVFETIKHLAEDYTPRSMVIVVEKFFGELATLGFIGTVAFVITTDFGDAESLLGQLSFTYTGDGLMLIHEFETLHFIIFFVSVFFVASCLAVLSMSIGRRQKWAGFQKDLDDVLRDPHTTTHHLHKMMAAPRPPRGVEGTLTHEFLKSEETMRAQFLLFRQRFITDAECDVTIPEDFDFAQYLTIRITKILEQVVEISVIDWVVLWAVYLCVYMLWVILHMIYPDMASTIFVLGAFLFIQAILMLSSMSLFRLLASIQMMLKPSIKCDGDVVLPPSVPTLMLDDTEEEERGLRLVQLIEPRYTREMKLVRKESDKSVWERLIDLVSSRGTRASKHEQLFGALGHDGPYVILRCIKLVLLGTIVSYAVMFTLLFPHLWEISPVLPFLAMVPTTFAILLLPETVIKYVWSTSTEMMKDSDAIHEVLQEQKQEKLVKILRILSMLSYFLDQVEFLKQVSDGSSEMNEAMRENLSDLKWQELKDRTDPGVLEDLEELFKSFDEDQSGELDENEVEQLVGQLGSKLSKEESANLFRIMDADGSGSVDFREFAVVILHQKTANTGKTNFLELADKMFSLFDRAGTGKVKVQDILNQMEAMGKNWDRQAIKYFLDEVDCDGSGDIEKHEFVDYMKKVEAEVSL